MSRRPAQGANVVDESGLPVPKGGVEGEPNAAQTFEVVDMALVNEMVLKIAYLQAQTTRGRHRRKPLMNSFLNVAAGGGSHA